MRWWRVCSPHHSPDSNLFLEQLCLRLATRQCAAPPPSTPVSLCLLCLPNKQLDGIIRITTTGGQTLALIQAGGNAVIDAGPEAALAAHAPRLAAVETVRSAGDAVAPLRVASLALTAVKTAPAGVACAGATRTVAYAMARAVERAAPPRTLRPAPARITPAAVVLPCAETR